MSPHSPDHEVELYREDDAYTIIVDLPGADRDEINVHYHDRRLDVSAHTDAAEENSSVKSHSVSVPHSIREDDIQATYDGGLLEVTLPISTSDTHPGTEIEIE